jgi:hypothetical protein
MTRGVGVRTPGVSQRVLAYLRENANVEVPYAEILRELGLQYPHQVSNAIQHLQSKGVPVDRPMRGIVIYRAGLAIIPPKPEPKSAARDMYESVGQTIGHRIVRDERDELFVLTPLEEWVKLP